MMPNPTVPAAATGGLPLPRPDLGDIMRAAHEACRAMPARLPYADRLAVALRRAWADMRAAVLQYLREAVAYRVERLLAFLDAIDGDHDLEDGADLGDHDSLWEQGLLAGRGLEFTCSHMATTGAAGTCRRGRRRRHHGPDRGRVHRPGARLRRDRPVRPISGDKAEHLSFLVLDVCLRVERAQAAMEAYNAGA